MDTNGGADGTRHMNYAIACLIICVVVELTSIGCNIPFNIDHDETDGTYSLVAYILMSVGVVGQLLSFFLVSFVARMAKRRDSKFSKEFTYGIGIISIPSLGLLQLAATILMAVALAKNDDENVQGYASAIVGLNFAATILAVAYGVFFYLPLQKDDDYKQLTK